ncbi:uncharacterized protein LOC112576539 [Pomacea canaliculata]|uniref:uncharacterized protein LOC112576539 n=1 Tax=Pomacea canaliculata TaxID=400727 RepID=UPI000D72C1B0|nr:uncharacterized protein LOC112576539 [Pomacea canaliculata]
MSLLNQMRPSISEKHTRNGGVRSNYDPHFNLYKHITIPDVRTVTAHNHLLSVDRVKLLGKEPKTEICLYQTLHGKLDKDLIKKFSDSLFWNSAYKSEFINFLGSNIRCDSRTHEPHSDMFAALDKAPPPVDREAQEWQQVRATSNGLLHEDKVWEPRNPRPWFQTDPISHAPGKGKRRSCGQMRKSE